MLNKKVLVAAVIGTLFAGSAAAANLSASTGAIPAYFAKEIVATTASPAELKIKTNNVTAAYLTWDINYNFSDGEVRYARIECSDNIKFATASDVALNDALHGDVGALNGLGTNVVTFSLTSNAGVNRIVGSDTLSLRGDHKITGTNQDVTCSVGLYDQPSQAQAGGSAGLIQNTAFSGAYISFAQSYELTATPTVHYADVEADPSFSDFVNDTDADLDKAYVGNSKINFKLSDPDGTAGTQTGAFGLTGSNVTLADLFGANTAIEVAGDYTLTNDADGNVDKSLAVLGAVSAANTTLTASKATYKVGNTAQSNVTLVLERSGEELIPESEYVATLKAVAAGTSYKPTDITGVKLGSILRNGTELQAPLAQIPGGWISRLVLTNTSAIARPYSIKLLNVGGETAVTPGTLTGTIPANGTKVIDDLTTVFTGNNRATIVVNVAGPDKSIQGLYQIVNPTSGSVSNHVMVRPGSN